MQVSISSTLTILHDGRFWVGICERRDGALYGACRFVFGPEPVSYTHLVIEAFACALRVRDLRKIVAKHIQCLLRISASRFILFAQTKMTTGVVN